MIQLFAILLLLTAPQVFAADVRLLSVECGSSRGLQSWGYVFSANGRVYVLASSDYIYNTNDPAICHKAVDSEARTYPLKLLRYDWSSGLALLQGPDTLRNFANSLSAHDITLLETATWRGGSGVIASTDSPRHLFASAQNIFELDGGPSTAAAVGSAVLASDGAVIGFVASQWVEEVPGQNSRIVRWLDYPTASSRNLLAFSVAFVNQWVTNALNPSWKPTFIVRYTDQLKHRYRVSLGPISFSEDCPSSSQGQRTDSAYPIGGGEGSGIGGDGKSQSSCLFHLSLSGDSTVPSLAAARASWLHRNVTYLATKPDLAVRFAYYRDYDTRLLQGFGIVSLGHLGRQLLDPKIGLLLDRNGAKVPGDIKLNQLRKAAQVLDDDVTKSDHFGLPAYWLDPRAYLYPKLLLTDDWNEVLTDDLAALFRDYTSDNRTGKFQSDIGQTWAARKALDR